MTYTKRKPCAKCPFRSDAKAYLKPERVDEIEKTLERGTFPCHETVAYTGEEEPEVSENSQHCAGALILLEKLKRPSQMMRIAETLRLYDRRKLDKKAPVYATFEEMRAACENTTVGKATEKEKLVRESCHVASDDCKQPAGYRYGGTGCANTDKKKPIPLCYQCGQPVCYSCSKRVKRRDKVIRLCEDCLDG